MREAELVFDSKDILGEGPYWDSSERILYWVDILGQRIHIYDPATKHDDIFSVNDLVSAVIPCTSDKLLIAGKHTLALIDIKTKQFETKLHIEALPDNVRLNDGKCDARGRFWIGSMDINEKEKDGCLYCVNADFGYTEKLSGVIISNGLAWNRENTKMYYIDTPTRQIAQFDFDLESRAICNPKTIISFPVGNGFPDGMASDSENCLWIAHFGGGMVSRWNPENGQCLESYKVPARNVTSCCFGGVEMDELFITTAGFSRNVTNHGISDGGLFKLKTDVTGLHAAKFAYQDQTQII
jgi:sugar lactone lactonase YvrE